MAFGGGGPHFCLGTNLARMEIRVMFQHLLDRMPDIRLDGEVQRLQSAFINGVKHLPISFSASAPVAGPTVGSSSSRGTTLRGLELVPPSSDSVPAIRSKLRSSGTSSDVLPPVNPVLVPTSPLRKRSLPCDFTKR